MPRSEVVFYKHDDETAPAYDALRALWASGRRKPLAKCLVRIERLAELGHELRRPEADYLRDGIHELRATFRSVPYRILYFFHGRQLAEVSRLITKQDVVQVAEINRAIADKARFAADPAKHTLRI